MPSGASHGIPVSLCCSRSHGMFHEPYFWRSSFEEPVQIVLHRSYILMWNTRVKFVAAIRQGLCLQEVMKNKKRKKENFIQQNLRNHYLAGVITMFLNSTGPWSPCICSGPGSPSLLSKAPPVIPGISWLQIIVFPFAITVTIRPTSVISKLLFASELQIRFIRWS